MKLAGVPKRRRQRRFDRFTAFAVSEMGESLPAPGAAKQGGADPPSPFPRPQNPKLDPAGE